MMSMGMGGSLLVLLSGKSSIGRLDGSAGKEVCLFLRPTWWKERNHSFHMQNKIVKKFKLKSPISESIYYDIHTYVHMYIPKSIFVYVHVLLSLSLHIHRKICMQ